MAFRIHFIPCNNKKKPVGIKQKAKTRIAVCVIEYRLVRSAMYKGKKIFMMQISV